MSDHQEKGENVINRTSGNPFNAWDNNFKYSSASVKNLRDSRPGLLPGDTCSIIRSGPTWVQLYLSRHGLGIIFISLNNCRRPLASLLTKFWLVNVDVGSSGLFSATFERAAYGSVTLSGSASQISLELQNLAKRHRADLDDALVYLFREFLRQKRQNKGSHVRS